MCAVLHADGICVNARVPCGHNVLSTTFRSGLADQITVPPHCISSVFYACAFKWSNAVRLHCSHKKTPHFHVKCMC